MHMKLHNLTLLLLLIFTGLSTTVSAEKRLFRVLGSYADETNAISERERLVRVLDKSVEVRFDTNRSVYRVIVDADLVSETDLRGIDSWLMRIDIPSTAGASPVVDEPRQVSLAAPVETEETVKVETTQPMGPLYPEFLPGETLSAYCSRLPDSRLCLHPRMQQAIEQDRKLREHRAAVNDACSRMANPELRKTCEEMGSE